MNPVRPAQWLMSACSKLTCRLRAMLFTICLQHSLPWLSTAIFEPPAELRVDANLLCRKTISYRIFVIHIGTAGHLENYSRRSIILLAQPCDPPTAMHLYRAGSIRAPFHGQVLRDDHSIKCGVLHSWQAWGILRLTIHEFWWNPFRPGVDAGHHGQTLLGADLNEPCVDQLR